MTDKNLIFLISQPRSGSTLTQKIIGSHKDIYTRSEPWIMLHPLYSLKEEGINAEYSKEQEYKATQDFINNLPGGRESYIKYLGDVYGSMYHDYLAASKKNIFLDKTPRYYLIINELKEVFPNAKFILLIRNPLAVLSSIINTWTKDNLSLLSNLKVDLIDGLDVIVDQISDNQNGLYLLRYETMLSDPTETLKDCFKYLDLEFDPDIMNYHTGNTDKKWLYGDPENVYKKQGIDSTNDLQWVNSLTDWQHWRLINDYLNYIGKDRFEILGYNFDDFSKILLKKLPSPSIDELEKNTIPLFQFLESTEEKEERISKQVQYELDSLKEKNKHLIKSMNEIKTSKIYRFTHMLTKPFQRVKP